MRKTYLIILLLTLAVILFVMRFTENQKKEPVIFTQNDSIENLTIDQKIEQAELIVIGRARTILPSRWLAPKGEETRNPSPEEVFRSGGLFTDTLITIDQILKGSFDQPIVRVRSYIGEIEQVRWVNSSEPSFERGQIYLLFLLKDIGLTKNVDPGDYVSVNSNTAVYKIVDGRAISADDEWVLEDLIAYIEQSLSAETPLPPTDLPAESFTDTTEPTEPPVETTSPTP
ncbi:MAG TPA: hypothetical protein VFG81_20785 [Anaerolineales bacterium]|jgi:hypothetical protein|nr:hypothetical protein [Anaerolineales bacterium]